MMIVQIREESYCREPQDFSGWPGHHIGRLPKPNLCNANTQKNLKEEKGCAVVSLERDNNIGSIHYSVAHTGFIQVKLIKSV